MSMAGGWVILGRFVGRLTLLGRACRIAANGAIPPRPNKVPAMPDTPNNRHIQETARAAYEAARNLQLPAGSPNTLRNVQAVAGGLVDALVDAAQQIAARVVKPADDVAALALWDDVCDKLGAHWLTPTIYCTRTGRNLGDVSPAGWLDYLRLIAAMPVDDPARTHAVDRLVAAIVSQKAYAIAPIVLDQSGAGLSLARLVDARDFCLMSFARFMSPTAHGGSHSVVLAQSGEILAQARDMMADLPTGVLAYAAECLGLYLSHIDPAKLGPGLNPLAHYGADMLAPWRSIATVGHLCGRLVQGLVSEIATLRLKPASALTKSDLRRLRVHYTGSPGHQQLRANLAAYRAAIRQGIADRAHDARQSKQRLTTSQRDALGAVKADASMAELLDLLDLQAVIGATGRGVPVQLDQADAPAVMSRRDQVRAARQSHADALLGDDLLDLTMLLTGDLPDDFLPALTDEADLISSGIFTADEIAGLEFDLADGWADADDDAPDDDVQDVADLLDSLGLDALLADAMPTVGRRAQAIQPGKPVAVPVPPALDLQSDLQAAMLQAAIDASPAAPIQRRKVVGSGNPPVTVPPSVQPAQPAQPAPGGLILRRRPV